MIQDFADWLVYGLFGLSADTPIGVAVNFFFYDTIKGIERFRRSTFYLLRCFISYIQVVFRFVLHLPAHFRHEGKQGCVRQSFRKGGS